MEDTKQQRDFTKDLIDAGYKKYGSEEENQILRYLNKNEIVAYLIHFLPLYSVFYDPYSFFIFL